MPIVLTYTEKQATEQLEARKLKVKVKTVNGKDDETKGTIVDQDPKGGATVPVDSTVTITLNAGPEDAKVPDGLVGKDLDEVTQELEEAGFTNVDTKAAKEEDPDNEPNEVLTVSPKSGSAIALDAKVTVTYATGKSPCRISSEWSSRGRGTWRGTAASIRSRWSRAQHRGATRHRDPAEPR